MNPPAHAPLAARCGRARAFLLLALLLGFGAGVFIWLILRVIHVGTAFLWQRLPAALGIEAHSSAFLLYALATCIAGGALIGLWQRRHGVLPDNLEEVMARIQRDGFYPYHRLHIIAIAAILPLIFGGALGPEAGLSGLIAGLCYWMGARLARTREQIAALAEAGFAATLGVIFQAPFFGLVHTLEPDAGSSSGWRQQWTNKRHRILISCAGILGAFAAFHLLGRIFAVHVGLPRFPAQHAIGWAQWQWFVPLLALGILCAHGYLFAQRIIRALARRMANRPVSRAMLAGAILAVCGWALPLTLFSGEHQLPELMQGWHALPPALLVATAAVKLALVSVCIELGWRGGSIFPLIFSSAALGYAFAQIVGMDGNFAVAMLASALYAHILRKPLAVVAILLLCFPLTYLFPLLISALIAARIPVQWRQPANDHLP